MIDKKTIAFDHTKWKYEMLITGTCADADPIPWTEDPYVNIALSADR
jgi:hypothetical protein